MRQNAGLPFARTAIATALAKGVPAETAKITVARWGVAKAATEAGATLSGSWGADLTDFERQAVEFFEAVAELSVIGQMAGLRRVPPLTRCVTRVDATTAEWRGEGQPQPISAGAFAAEALPLRELAAMTVVSRELLENGSTLAERAVRDDLLRAVADAMDRAFLDPANTGTPGVKPASITAGLTATNATNDLRADLAAFFAAFGGDMSRAYFIMHPATAAGLTSADHPGIGARGGELCGTPVLTTRNCPPGLLVLVDPAGIAVAEGEGRAITSEHASVEMETTPTGDATTPTAVEVVSLWQTNSVALGVSRQVNWSVIRPGAVALLDLAGDSA